MNHIDPILTLIAQKHLGIEALETRKSDRLDFHDTAVWCIRDALEAAFMAGIELGVSMPKATESEIADTRSDVFEAKRKVLGFSAEQSVHHVPDQPLPRSSK